MMYIIYHRLCVLWIALLLIMLSIPHIVVGSDQSESVCNPLPEGQRFSAAGYELGMCYKDVESLVKTKGYTLNEYLISEDYRDTSPLIKLYHTDFTDVVPPLKGKLESFSPLVSLVFYKNQLYDISVNLSYPKNIGSENLKTITDIIAKKITERIGTLPVFNKDTKELEWYFENVKISLYELSTQFTDPSLKETLIGSFSISYSYQPIEKQAEQYRTETVKKRRQKEEDTTSGF